MVMVHLFNDLGFKFGIAHCNFSLRGAESDADALFVHSVASALNIEYFEKDFDTLQFAQRNRLSIQEAARNLRYNWFDQLIRKTDYDYYATAHHFDDQIETFFINIFRGSGVSGLKGIQSKNGFCIRPMLFARRTQIEKFAHERGIKFREDSSNSEDKYLRNRIRHHLIPVLDDIKPEFRKGFDRTYSILRETDNLLRSAAEDFEKDVLIERENGCFELPVEKLKQFLPHSKILLFEVLRKFGFNQATLENIVESLDRVPGQIFLSETHKIVRDRDALYLSRKTDKKLASPLEMIEIEPDTDKKINPIRIRFEKYDRSPKFKIANDHLIAQLDWKKLKFPLILRKPETGDYFYPLGMQGKKKLSDFFMDNKFTYQQKKDIWLLESQNNIVWIVGHRIDNRFKIDYSTQIIFEAGYEKDENPT